MTKLTHKLFIGSMIATTLFVTYYIATTGYSYYSLSLEERFYHESYDWFKPSGIFGQGLGVIGTLMITFGVSIYIVRKRYGFLENFIRLKYLLEFHIFLCTLGPILILFHTTFKFGGIVAIAFWSMLAVVLSGIIGRFIYVQIPRTIEGRQLSIQEIHLKRENIEKQVNQISSSSETASKLVSFDGHNGNWGLKTFIGNYLKTRQISNSLKSENVSKQDRGIILSLVREEMSLASKISRLHQMQKLFKYWHVVHMPFAIIMLIIVLIHVGVSIALGYKWIF